MDFRASRDRATRPADVDEEGTTAPPAPGAHDFDAPAWRPPARGLAQSAAWRRRSPRLIDLERRARFARVSSDSR